MTNPREWWKKTTVFISWCSSLRLCCVGDFKIDDNRRSLWGRVIVTQAHEKWYISLEAAAMKTPKNPIFLRPFTRVGGMPDILKYRNNNDNDNSD